MGANTGERSHKIHHLTPTLHPTPGGRGLSNARGMPRVEREGRGGGCRVTIKNRFVLLFLSERKLQILLSPNKHIHCMGKQF